MEMMLTDRYQPPAKSVAAINLASAVSAYLVRWYFCNRLFGLSGDCPLDESAFEGGIQVVCPKRRAM